MSDKNRKLALVALLGIVIAYLVGDSLYQSYYTKPLQAEQNRKQELEDELHKVKLAVLRTKNKLQYVSTYQDRSLPSKPEYAVSEYHDWLLSLIEQSGLKRLNLNSSKPSTTAGRLRRITFTVRAGGTLKQITKFLHTFYETGHLHKIRSLALNPSASGQVSMTVSIEAISLANATSADTLTESKANRLAGETFEFYDFIARRDLFQGLGNNWGKLTKLTGITKNRDGELEAWFQTGNEKVQAKVKQNDPQLLGDIRFTLVEKAERGVRVLVDGEPYTMQLGQTFAECFQAVSAP